MRLRKFWSDLANAVNLARDHKLCLEFFSFPPSHSLRRSRKFNERLYKRGEYSDIRERETHFQSMIAVFFLLLMSSKFR